MSHSVCACKQQDVNKFNVVDRRYTTDLGTCHDRFDPIETVRAETRRLLEEQRKAYQEKLDQLEKSHEEEIDSLAKTMFTALSRQKSELTREIIDVYKKIG